MSSPQKPPRARSLSSAPDVEEVHLANEEVLAQSMRTLLSPHQRYHDRLRLALEALEDEELPLEGVPSARLPLVASAREMIKLDRLRGLHVPEASKHHLVFPTLLALYTREHARPVFTISRLTRILDAPSTTCLRQVHRMVGMGLLEKVDHPTDARSSSVALTAHARAMLDNFFAAASERLHRMG